MAVKCKTEIEAPRASELRAPATEPKIRVRIPIPGFQPFSIDLPQKESLSIKSLLVIYITQEFIYLLEIIKE